MAQHKLNDQATIAFQEARKIIYTNPLFHHLDRATSTIRHEKNVFPSDALIYGDDEGRIYCNAKIRLSKEEWVYLIAHALLHLAFGHFQEKAKPLEWNRACDIFVFRFLQDLKIGKPLDKFNINCDGIPLGNEEELYKFFCREGIPDHLKDCGTGSPFQSDLFFSKEKRYGQPTNWQKLFGWGLRDAVTQAVNEASGIGIEKHYKIDMNSKAQRAKSWFISSYPLLGALAVCFEVIEDVEFCKAQDIPIAAVHTQMKEIYINPAAGLTEDECRFVIAHEIMHVSLRHDIRREWRDAYLWNVACDYVINLWLVEMRLGAIPSIGGLYDESLKGLSAESIYDRIAVDLRRLRKLKTMRGREGKSDIIDAADPSWWNRQEGMDLDSFYRRALSQGLELHKEQGRGLLPAGLIEEIRALSQPPIPWDVKLAEWFDAHFAPLEKIKSYARISRRQSSTPDIPRPSYRYNEEEIMSRTFGVVLDTSGSMDRVILAKALGAIASYAISRNVMRVRLVYCDATAYDAGYILPEQLLESVEVKGRGGTVLQPAISLLEKAENFPINAPILVITDGGCDVLRIKRDHAFLLPFKASLPFHPQGEVFRVR